MEVEAVGEAEVEAVEASAEDEEAAEVTAEAGRAQEEVITREAAAAAMISLRPLLCPVTRWGL